MKQMKILDTYNALVGGVIAFLSMVFGEYWYLFALFIVLNVIDWVTGWLKARIMGKENSVAGLKGVIKKLGYWLMILFAFVMSQCFVQIGHTIGLDLGVTQFLGWFVLASLMVNEARSILENFIQAGYPVPHALEKGLEVAETAIDKIDHSEKSE